MTLDSKKPLNPLPAHRRPGAGNRADGCLKNPAPVPSPQWPSPEEASAARSELKAAILPMNLKMVALICNKLCMLRFKGAVRAIQFRGDLTLTRN